MTSLPRTFSDRDAREVAIDLLGRHLVRTSGAVDPHQRAVATIVETAAYLSSHDLACRACQGRIPRTAMMVGARGHANVFPICDMYHCLDAVTGRDGTTGAVLIRTVFVGHDKPPRQGGRCRCAWPGRLTPAIEVTPGATGVSHPPSPMQLPAGPRPVARANRDQPTRSGPRAEVYVAVPGRDAKTLHHEPGGHCAVPGTHIKEPVKNSRP